MSLPTITPTRSDEFLALIHAAKWTVVHGDHDLAQALKAVIEQNYSHLREELWAELSPTEQQRLRALITSNPQRERQLEFAALEVVA